MCIQIRPHHLLCIPGYKGFNYNSESVKNWNNVIKDLKNNPEQNIFIKLSEDSLCKECVHRDKNTCDNFFINKIDNRVKVFLDLKENVLYKFSELMKEVFVKMNPEKQNEFCLGCNWQKIGLCKDTFGPMENYLTFIKRQMK